MLEILCDDVLCESSRAVVWFVVALVKGVKKVAGFVGSFSVFSKDNGVKKQMAF